MPNMGCQSGGFPICNYDYNCSHRALTPCGACLGAPQLPLLNIHSKESQNGCGWPGPLGPSAPTPAQQGHQHRVPRAIPGNFERSPRRRLQNLSRQLVPVLCQHTAQKCSMMFRGNLLCCTVYPFPLCILFTLSFHIFLYTDKISLEPSLLQTEQSQFSQAALG